MIEPVRWLLIEGVIALFGAGVLYLALSVCYKIVGNTTAFSWGEAVDSMGWLYGAMVIGIQSAVRLFRVEGGTMQIQAYTCVVVTVFCCLLLIVAMIQRGGVETWKPPWQLKSFAAVLAVVILYLGYTAHEVAA